MPDDPSLALLPQAWPALPSRQSLGFKVFFHSIDYTEGLNLGFLQTSGHDCRNKYSGRSDAVILGMGMDDITFAVLMIQDLQCLLN